MGGMNEAVEAARAAGRRRDDVFLPDQFSNPANPEIHRRTTAPEIWDALDGRIDVFVAGVGTGGTITGVGELLKERNPTLPGRGGRARRPRRCCRAAAGPAQDPGHRRRVRARGAQPRSARRDDRRRRRGRDRDRAAGGPRVRASWPASPCGAALCAALQVAEPPGVRGRADRRRSCRTRASATSRRRSSPPERRVEGSQLRACSGSEPGGVAARSVRHRGRSGARSGGPRRRRGWRSSLPGRGARAARPPSRPRAARGRRAGRAAAVAAVARSLTGVEIHPAARIGARCSSTTAWAS